MLRNVTVVLVGPMFGGNVGATCRAIKNAGLSPELRVVRPIYEDENEAQKFCHGAEEIYESRKIYEGLVDAIRDCRVVAGFSVRERHRRKFQPLRRFAEGWVADALADEEAPPTALLFGRERDGLTNDELDLCSELVWIPSHQEHQSYNLAQAVLLAGYELLMAQIAGDPEAPRVKPRMTNRPPTSKLAQADELDDLYKDMREGFLDIGYAYEHTVDHMVRSYHEIFSRARLMGREAKMLRGLARQMQWAGKQIDESREGDGRAESSST